MAFFQENIIYIIIIAVVILMTVVGYFADKKGFGKSEKKEKTPKNDTKGENIEPVIQNSSIQNVDTEEPASLTDDFAVPADLNPVEDKFNSENVESGLNFDMDNFETPVSYETNVEEPAAIEEQPAQEEPMEDIFKNYDNTVTEETVEEPTPVVQEELPVVEDTENVFENTSKTQEEPIPTVEEPTVAIDGNEQSSKVVDETVEQPNEELYNVDNGFSFNDIVEEPVKEEEPVVMEEQPVQEVPTEPSFDTNEELVPEEDFKLPSIENLNQELQEVNNNDEDVWKF